MFKCHYRSRKDAILKFYEVMAVHMLMFGLECWAINKTDRRAGTAAEIKFLRHIPQRPHTQSQYSTKIKNLQLKL
jgi:hypothetical protein